MLTEIKNPGRHPGHLSPGVVAPVIALANSLTITKARNEMQGLVSRGGMIGRIGKVDELEGVMGRQELLGFRQPERGKS